MYLTYFIKGSSSLLFIISTIKALYSSNLIFWKTSNAFLVVASFLCNATDYKKIFLLTDYLAIFLVCTSYINNIYINTTYFLFLIYEYNKYNSIENTKNLAFITAISKSTLYTYLYVDNIHFCVICASSIFGTIIYKIRYHVNVNNNEKYILLITYLFHICTMNILYVSSITAQHNFDYI
jgi:hypothetical protein